MSRLGTSGGVVITIDADIAQSLRQLGELKKQLVKDAKDIKLKPEIDWEAAQINRGLQREVDKARRQLVSGQVATQAQAMGISVAGGVAPFQVAYQAAKARDAEMAEFRKFVAKHGYVFGYAGGENTAEASRYLSSFSIGPRAKAQVVSGRDPEPLNLRDSVKRMEAERAKNELPINQLAEAVGKANAKNPPAMAFGRGFGIGSGMMLGGMYATIGAASEGISTYSRFRDANAKIGFDNAAGSLTGRLEKQEALNSLPIIGKLNRAFDELYGTTKSLKIELEGIGKVRALDVQGAALQRNSRAALRAKTDADIANIIDEYAGKGIEMEEDDGFIYIRDIAKGVSLSAQRAAQRVVRRARSNQALAMQRQEEEQKAGWRTMEAATEAARIGMDNPMLAERILQQAEHKNRIALADDWDLAKIKKQNEAEEEDLKRRQNRKKAFAAFDAETRIATSETRVRNQGVATSEDSVLSRMRALKREIDMTPEEGGLKRMATLAALSEMRAMKAELNPRGGGFGQQINMATTAIGDTLGLEPETQARARAQKMLDRGIREIGDMGAGDLSIRNLPNSNGSDLGKILGIFEYLRDNVFTKPAMIILRDQ